MTIPEELRAQLRSQKLHVALKAQKMMVMEKVIFSAEVPFTALAHANELRKALKYDKVQFGVIVRIR